MYRTSTIDVTVTSVSHAPGTTITSTSVEQTTEYETETKTLPGKPTSLDCLRIFHGFHSLEMQADSSQRLPRLRLKSSRPSTLRLPQRSRLHRLVRTRTPRGNLTRCANLFYQYTKPRHCLAPQLHRPPHSRLPSTKPRQRHFLAPQSPVPKFRPHLVSVMTRVSIVTSIGVDFAQRQQKPKRKR